MPDTATTESSTTEAAAAPTPEPNGTGAADALEASSSEATKEGASTKATVTLPKSIKPPEKTGRFQERFSALVSQRDLSQREAAQLRERVAQLEATQKQGTAPAAASPQANGVNPEDFPTYQDYITALVTSTLEKKQASEQQAKAKSEYDTYKQERMTSFNTHAAPLAKQYGEGFWDTIADPSLPVTEAMADAVMELDQLGPYTMLYLAAHRDEAARIAKLNPRAATMAIGRLAAQLDAELKQGASSSTESGAQEMPSGNQMSLARPTPVPTPRGSTPSLTDAPSDKDSVDDWLRKETDRLRRINPNARFYGAR